MIKASIEDDFTLINIYTPNSGSPQYMEQILTDIKEKLMGTQQ